MKSAIKIVLEADPGKMRMRWILATIAMYERDIHPQKRGQTYILFSLQMIGKRTCMI